MTKKRISKNSFPKIAPLSRLNKLTHKDFNQFNWEGVSSKDAKQIRSALARQELLWDRDNNIVVINLKYCSINQVFQPSRLIKLVRTAIDISQSGLRLGLWGLCELNLSLNLVYGSKDSIKLANHIKTLIEKHALAYLEYLGKTDFEWSIDLETPLKAYDSILLRDSRGLGKFDRLWYYTEENDTYYILDRFLNALLSYGYSRDQVRSAIHVCDTSKGYEVIPGYLRARYLRIPDAGKVMEETIKC